MGAAISRDRERISLDKTAASGTDSIEADDECPACGSIVRQSETSCPECGLKLAD